MHLRFLNDEEVVTWMAETPAVGNQISIQGDDTLYQIANVRHVFINSYTTKTGRHVGEEEIIVFLGKA